MRAAELGRITGRQKVIVRSPPTVNEGQAVPEGSTSGKLSTASAYRVKARPNAYSIERKISGFTAKPLFENSKEANPIGTPTIYHLGKTQADFDQEIPRKIEEILKKNIINKKPIERERTAENTASHLLHTKYTSLEKNKSSQQIKMIGILKRKILSHSFKNGLSAVVKSGMTSLSSSVIRKQSAQGSSSKAFESKAHSRMSTTNLGWGSPNPQTTGQLQSTP